MRNPDSPWKCHAYAVAKARGQSRYFTGRPCRHGHLAERYTANRRCVECCGVKCARR